MEKCYSKSCPLQMRHSARVDNILWKFWSLKMPHRKTRHFKTRSRPITPHLAIIQVSALSLIGPLPQFGAISTGATRSTNHFQRLLSAYQIKDNRQSSVVFNIYHSLVPTCLSNLIPCEGFVVWLCVASVPLLMWSLEYLFSCFPMFIQILSIP